MATYTPQTGVPIGDADPFSLLVLGFGWNPLDAGVITYGGNLYTVSFWSPSTFGIVISKSTDGGVTWTNIDTANGPLAATVTAGGCYVARGSTISVAFYDGPVGPPIYLYDFDLVSETWGTVYGIAGAPTIRTSGSGSGTSLVYRASSDDLVVFYEGDGGSGFWSAVYDIGGASWSSPIDAGVNITALANWGSAAPVITNIFTCCIDSDDNIYLFFSTEVNVAGTNDWSYRVFFQRFTTANARPSGAGDFYDFPGQGDINLNLNAQQTHPIGMPSIIGDNIFFPIEAIEPAGPFHHRYAGGWLGVGLAGATAWTISTIPTDPDFIPGGFANLALTAGTSCFDGTKLYVVYRGAVDPSIDDTEQIRLCQCDPTGDDPDAFTWTAQTVCLNTDSPFAEMTPGTAVQFYDPNVFSDGNSVQIDVSVFENDSPFNSARFFMGNPPVTPPDTGCMVAWLAINEPGSLSPVTPNTWTDQSHYLHVSESITFSWLVRQRGTAQIPLIILAGDDYMPTIGSQVCLWDITEDADYEVFSGTIDDLEVKWLGQNGDRIVTMTCVSLDQVFDVIRLPNLLFEDQTAGDIFAAVYAYAAGCPVALGDVQTGATIAQFNTPDFPSISDVFTRLATESQYVWGVDPGTGTVYFTPPNVTPSPFTVDSEDVLWEQFTLKEERHDYRNNQKLKVNANAAVSSKELFAGTGQQSYTLLRPCAQITNGWITYNVQNSATGTFTGQPSVGDTITFQTPSSGSGYNWSPGGTYAVGAIIIDSNGYTQKVTTSVGVTGATEPAWIEIYGQITQDNLVQWQNQGQQSFQNGDLADYTFVDSLEGYYGATGVWPITADNPLGKMPANAQFGLVLIGSTLAATIQNLADAINAIHDLAGVTFSLATWENPVVNADTPAGGTTIIVRNKAAEASYITALDDTCANFSWSSPLTTGGLTTFGTQVITFGVDGQTTGGSVFTVVYTPGSAVIHSATPLNAGTSLQIEYLAVNAGYIQVEDTAQVIERAAIEEGTGKYQQTSSDDSALSLPVGLQLVQQQLAAFVVIPKTFTFTTMRAGLYVGQALDIEMLSPDNAPELINGDWFIQEIQAEVVPIYGPNGESDRWLPNGGHFKYTVTCIDVAQIGSWLQFWLGLSNGGGGGGGGSAVFPGGGSLGPASASGTFGGVNEQTADYTALATDNGRIISMHAVGSPLVSLTLTLPAVPPSTTWCIFVQDTGSTNVDIDPGALELDGVVGILTLTPGQGVYISTDGINYFTSRGIGGSGGGSSYSQAFVAQTTVVVTHNLGTLVVIASVYDLSGNLVIPSNLALTDANTITVDFGIAQSGTVVVLGA